ncbi:MAG: hypothetical protein GX182_01630 [Firmicutes bacterium]|jgi:flagellar FliL protein|nr:hypothetical protein [Bacillota bacterium]
MESGRSLRLIIIFVALTILAAAVILYTGFALFGKHQQSEVVAGQPPVKERTSIGPTFDAGTFTVNLLPGQGRVTSRYLRTQLVFEVSSPKAIQELEQRTPQVKDKIISILRSKTVEEMMDPQGDNRLREEIKEGINQLLHQGEIVEVYFIDLVIQ